MARVYVASSWRNSYQPQVVRSLREAGHEVFDFRNPPHGRGGFRWSDVDPGYEGWSVRQYIEGLSSEVAKDGFENDLAAMLWADVCVLVLPCGRSAHAEAGWMKGRGKKTIVYMPEKQEAELMYRLFDGVVDSMEDLLGAI